MKSPSYLLSRIRLWGLKGIFNYILHRFYIAGKRRFFLRNARKYPMCPAKGITILADMTQHSSLSKVMRDFAFALKKAGVPFQTLDLHPRADFPHSDIKDILTPPDEFRILKYDHVIEMFFSPLPESLPLKRSRIVFWEFTGGLLEYFPALADSRSIIAMSDFNRDVFKTLLPGSTEVKKILYPFFFDEENIPERNLIRTKYGIPDKAFTVFFNFDYGSSFNRKNPDGSMKAFAKAFPADRNTRLVFKTKGASKHPEDRSRLLRLADELGIADRIVMIDDFIPQHDIYGLTAACDVYMSLHRGEGFGLGIAEAMSLAKPAVVTDYSSTTEFCNCENSIPVPYSIVEVPGEMHDHPCYHAVREWAEPDIDAAAKALEKLYVDEPLRRKTGNAAKKFITEHFSIENFRGSVEAFLG